MSGGEGEGKGEGGDLSGSLSEEVASAFYRWFWLVTGGTPVALGEGGGGNLIPRAHRVWTLSFGFGVGSDLRADREHSLGFDTAGPEAQLYHSINTRKAKGRWYECEFQ